MLEYLGMLLARFGVYGITIYGGYGEGTCTRDGTKWLFATTATLADGRTMTATNILTPIDRDAFVWQPVDLTIDDEPIGNLPPVKVTRVKAK